jgi:hypothetical protein
MQREGGGGGDGRVNLDDASVNFRGGGGGVGRHGGGRERDRIVRTETRTVLV